MNITKTLKTIGKLLSPLKKSIISLFLIVAFLLIDVYCNLTLPKYTADIVDVGIQNTDFNYIINVGTMMMAMVLIGVLATIGLSYFSSKVSAAYGRDLRKLSYDKILKKRCISDTDLFRILLHHNTVFTNIGNRKHT